MPAHEFSWFNLRVWADGWCKGNPGPSGATAAVEGFQPFVLERKFFFGRGTNNSAEYLAVINALLWVKELRLPSGSTAEVNTDSQLVDGHFNKQWKVNEGHLKLLLEALRELVHELELKGTRVSIKKVPRFWIEKKVGH